MFFMRYLFMGMLAVGVALAATALSQPANAQGAEINTAKDAGVIGERIDGYLGIVDNGAVDSSLQRRVNEINARRRAAFDEVASQTGATVAQVARITGEKQIERLGRGQYYMDESGSWVRKGS